MKRTLMKSVVLLVVTIALRVQAQYQITSSSVGGGGGQSTGGAYVVTGSVGQPGAGLQSGGVYTLAGGFWSLVAAVQVEGAPALRILHNGAECVVAWPNPSTGFQLQASPSLSASAWSDVNAVPVVVGAEKQISLPAEAGLRFFRLHKP